MENVIFLLPFFLLAFAGLAFLFPFSILLLLFDIFSFRVGADAAGQKKRRRCLRRFVVSISEKGAARRRRRRVVDSTASFRLRVEDPRRPPGASIPRPQPPFFFSPLPKRKTLGG